MPGGFCAQTDLKGITKPNEHRSLFCFVISNGLFDFKMPLNSHKFESNKGISKKKYNKYKKSIKVFSFKTTKLYVFYNTPNKSKKI